ncbi:RsmG family class I SAM-dependent methyltransferase, partial [Abiotrophia defectiva]
MKELIDELLRVNQQFNLTAIRDPHDAWVKHIIDSVQGVTTGLFEGHRA